MSLAGQVALVTGGAVGIGEAITRALLAAGAEVVVNYNKSDAAAAALMERTDSKVRDRITLFKADVSKSEDVKRMVQQVSEKHGRIDILVNNAGVVRDGLIFTMSDGAWDEVRRVNLDGAFYCIREVGKIMMQRRCGRIVNISSISGRHGGKGQANYAAAKAALNALTRVAALELASKGITVNGVAPGVVVTRMSQRVREHAGDRILAGIPLGRYGEPDDVARVVMFLANPDVSYVTGQVIDVNGGLGL